MCFCTAGMYFSGLGRLIKCVQYLTALRHSSTGVTDLAQRRTFCAGLRRTATLEVLHVEQP